MNPIEIIAEAKGPEGETLQLVRRGDVLIVQRDRFEWLRSDHQGFYEALATLGCPDLRMKRTPRALLLGVGMGLGVRRVLDLIGKRGKVSVWDPVSVLAGWNADAFASLNGGALGEHGVKWVNGDLASVLKGFQDQVDVLLVDEDHRDQLEDAGMLKALCGVLRNGGTLAWWGPKEDRKLLTELKVHGFEMNIETVFPRPNNKGRSQKVFVAQLPFVGED